SFEAYNRWLADFVAHAPDRFTGVGYVSMYEVEDAVRQMRRCAELGHTGVNLPAFPQNLDPSLEVLPHASQLLALTGDPNGPRSYGDAEFDPIWRTACDLGL